MAPKTLPKGLRTWFIIHFVLDVAAALPLFFFPTWFLGRLDWPSIDPYAARLVAAALFGIGIESWLGRDGDPSTFTHMLNLKIIWSAAAVLGLALSMLQAQGRPLAAQWLVLGVFLAFHGVWLYYRFQMKQP